MKTTRLLLAAVVLFLASGACARCAEPTKALKAPEPNRADEPIAAKLSLTKAAEFLDAASLDWTNKRKCGTCHTNYAYLMARPSLKDIAGPPVDEVRKFFEDRAANWDTNKPRWDTEVVATAATLAMNDAKTTGKLHPITRSALDRMWTLQRADGSWNWLKCNWPPLEHDDYFGVVYAALGVGIAPDKYAETPAAKVGIAKIRAYLKTNPPPSLHHKAMLLWASCHLPDLMPAKQRQSAIKELLALQQPDGGWCLPSLGDWTGFAGEPNDKNAPSDGYATGLVVYILREAGIPKEDQAVQKGVAWLKANQRESGRWFTRSLNTESYHFISHAGTAYAVMALRACEVE